MNVARMGCKRTLMGIVVFVWISLGIGLPLRAQQSDKPLDIGADNFETDRQKGTATFSGNARIVREDISTFCDQLTIFYTPDWQVEKAVATGNVQVLTQGTTATGEQGTFYVEEQKVELQGNARAVQGNNTITAHRIIAFIEEKIIEAYGDPEGGRVNMTIYSQQSPFPTEAPSEERPADESFSPIVVESDTLYYDNAGRKAIFTGNVIAKQDLTEINAEEMVAYVTGTEEDEEANDIDRIEVTDNVRIVQGGVTITGAKGVYFVPDQTAIIEGEGDQQAQAEDQSQNTLIIADLIRFFLTTNDVKAEGNVIVKTLISGQNKESDQ